MDITYSRCVIATDRGENECPLERTCQLWSQSDGCQWGQVQVDAAQYQRQVEEIY